MGATLQKERACPKGKSTRREIELRKRKQPSPEHHLSWIQRRLNLRPGNFQFLKSVHFRLNPRTPVRVEFFLLAGGRKQVLLHVVSQEPVGPCLAHALGTRGPGERAQAHARRGGLTAGLGAAGTARHPSAELQGCKQRGPPAPHS